jgi:hypothetical protein
MNQFLIPMTVIGLFVSYAAAGGRCATKPDLDPMKTYCYLYKEERTCNTWWETCVWISDEENGIQLKMQESNALERSTVPTCSRNAKRRNPA